MRFISLDRFDDSKETINEALGFSSKESMLQNTAYACSTFVMDEYEFIWDNYSDDEIIALWNLCLTVTKKNYASFLLVAPGDAGLCKGAAANGFVTLPIILEHIPKKRFTEFLEFYKENVPQ